ncbi:cytochrome P450 [Streptomyces sp. NBC_01483]|uniref:cytochrome P450 n=1 Tax=Streptomyces sp. NBC_01483 TaxID=2903883 RepID=UPI002E335772|nr:cytochrome P450 [Streptomyces sp. NBC_01483]
MDTEASPGSLPYLPGTGRPVPEAEPELVERWRSGGGELVELLSQVRERLGGIAAFRLGPAPTVLVTDPQAVQHVLARHPEWYLKRSHRARLLIGDGVLAATGEAWKRQRRLLQSQFTGTGMRRYERRITEAARTTAGRWDGYARTGQTLDIGQEMRRFALDAIWRSLTGHPLDDGTERELAAVAAVATPPGRLLPLRHRSPRVPRSVIRAPRIDRPARTPAAGPHAGLPLHSHEGGVRDHRPRRRPHPRNPGTDAHLKDRDVILVIEGEQRCNATARQQAGPSRLRSAKKPMVRGSWSSGNRIRRCVRTLITDRNGSDVRHSEIPSPAIRWTGDRSCRCAVGRMNGGLDGRTTAVSENDLGVPARITRRRDGRRADRTRG